MFYHVYISFCFEFSCIISLRKLEGEVRVRVQKIEMFYHVNISFCFKFTWVKSLREGEGEVVLF